MTATVLRRRQVLAALLPVTASPVSCLVAPSSDIANVKDLKGKKVA